MSEKLYGEMTTHPPIPKSVMAQLMEAVRVNDPDDIFPEHAACFNVGYEAGLAAGRAEAAADTRDAERRLLANEPTLVGRWRTKNGYLFCGTLRIAAADFDTAPRAEYRDAVLQDLCDAANFVVANYSDPCRRVSLTL